MYSLSEIRNVPMLTHEEEINLFTKYKNENCLKSIEKIILSHVRYVAGITRQYRNYEMDSDDLFQEGLIGLMKAAKTYEVERQYRFVSYATIYIRGQMLQFIKDNFGIVKTITTKAHAKLFFNLRKLRESTNTLSNANIKKLSEELNLSESDIRDMECRLYNTDVSLDIPINKDKEERTWVDMIENPNDTSYITLREQDEDSHKFTKLKFAIDKLDTRSKDIFTRRRLLESPLILDELSKEYGISKERIRQIEDVAFKKVQTYMLTN